MDAATPLRLLLAAALIPIGLGCHTADAQPVVRPQMPSEPPGPLPPAGPLAPTGPSAPLPPPTTPPVETKPFVAGAPIMGLPVLPTPVGTAAAPPMAPGVNLPTTVSTTVQTGYSASPDAKPPSIKSVLPAGEPRIKIVAHVGAGNIVTDEEVAESVKQRMREYTSIVDARGGQRQVIEDDVKKKVVYIEELRRTIERELILDEMYTKLKKASKGQVIEEIKEFAGKSADRQLREYKKRYGVETDEDFKMILLGQGLTIPVIRRQLERQMMADEYVRSMLREKNKGIGLSEVRAYFDSHPDDFRSPDRVKWLHIFVNSNKFANQRAAYDYSMIIQQHAAAGEDFPNLSRTYDHGLAGQANGVGYGSERGKIQPAELEAAVWSLKVGEVSGLIETPAGYHIVKVVERDYAGIKPYDDKAQLEVRRKIMHDLQEVEYKRLVEKLWRGGVVKVIEVP